MFGDAAMINIYPIKQLERIWDRIERSKLPKRLKAFLLTLVVIAMLAQSFWVILIVKQLVDLASALLAPYIT